MQLYLAHYLQTYRISAHDFFRSAHIWVFKKDAPIYNDVLAYNAQGTIPQYVQRYLQHLQEKT